MTPLLELADYSLHQLKRLPDEVAHTSRSKQWGITTENFRSPQPVMSMYVKRKENSKGVGCTLYDPPINAKQGKLDKRIENTYKQSADKDKRIDSYHVMNISLPEVSTKHRLFQVGTLPSCHLSRFDGNFNILSYITNRNPAIRSENNHPFVRLSFKLIAIENQCM